MSSVLRSVRKRKKGHTLGAVDVIDREEYAELEVDAKVELIRSLVPLGLMHIEELLDEEVTALAGERYARKAPSVGGRRHGSNPGALVVVLTTEEAVEANHRRGVAALYAADGLLAGVIAELADVPEWQAVLDGSRLNSASSRSGTSLLDVQHRPQPGAARRWVRHRPAAGDARPAAGDRLGRRARGDPLGMGLLAPVRLELVRRSGGRDRPGPARLRRCVGQRRPGGPGRGPRAGCERTNRRAGDRLRSVSHPPHRGRHGRQGIALGPHRGVGPRAVERTAALRETGDRRKEKTGELRRLPFHSRVGSPFTKVC